MVGGGAGGSTVTMVVAVLVPPPLVAVRVYVVVSVGNTVAKLPDTTPMPGETEMEVALVTDQRSVVDCPAVTEGESAAKELITGGEPLFCVPPPLLLEHAESRMSAAVRHRLMAVLPAWRRARRSRPRRSRSPFPSDCPRRCSRRPRWW